MLDRRLVGVFDTTTIAAKAPDALLRWLDENGYATGPDAKPVIEQHVRDGWVFVATKVRRDAISAGPATPHPLSFTFQTPKAVYPLRLTGVRNGKLTIDLFVIGDGRAHAKSFKVTECHQIERAAEGGTWRMHDRIKFGHPQILGWLQDAAVITRLEATLTPAEMQEDAELVWQKFRPEQTRVYSSKGAAQLAANWTIPIAAFVLLVIAIRAHRRGVISRRARMVGAATILVAGCVAMVIYLGVPKVVVRMQKMPGTMTRINLQILAMDCMSSFPTNQPVDVISVRKELSRQLAQTEPHHSENLILGGKIREEDSPGNYTLRAIPEGVEILGYDAAGAAIPFGLVPKPKSR